VPFEAYQTVSQPMDPDRVRQFLPGDRTYIDWNFNVDWVRRAPGDPSRIVFGGLTGARNQDLRIMAERLHLRLLRVFPDLADLRFENVWTGKCGGTFDLYPHIGRHEGIHYAVGYCFAGVPMGKLFGRKLARRITLHDLRRTFITVAEGMDISTYTLKRLLNHKDRRDVTAGYIVLNVERLREPMQRIATFILRAAGAEGSCKVIDITAGNRY
jgi:integrase